MALTQHWKLDDNAASTTVVATVGTNGTLEGGDNTSAKTTAGPGGIITAAFDLNGTDDAVAVSGISLAGTFSFSLWFNTDTASARHMIGTSAGSNNDRIGYASDTSIIVRRAVTLTYTVPSIGTGAWHHLLVTRDGSNNARVFMDGVESSTGSQSSTGTWAPNRIGLGATAGVFFDGKVAQVKVFDTDESANVATLYAEGTATPAAGRHRTLLGVGT